MLLWCSFVEPWRGLLKSSRIDSPRDEIAGTRRRPANNSAATSDELALEMLRRDRVPVAEVELDGRQFLFWLGEERST